MKRKRKTASFAIVLVLISGWIFLASGQLACRGFEPDSFERKGDKLQINSRADETTLLLESAMSNNLRNDFAQAKTQMKYLTSIQFPVQISAFPSNRRLRSNR